MYFHHFWLMASTNYVLFLLPTLPPNDHSNLGSVRKRMTERRGGLKSSPSHKLATSFYFAGPRLNCWSSIGSLQCTILRPLISNLRISCSFLPSSDREEGWAWRARRKGGAPLSTAPPPLYRPRLAQTGFLLTPGQQEIRLPDTLAPPSGSLLQHTVPTT